MHVSREARHYSYAGHRPLVLVVSKYAPGDMVLEGLEKEVREAKKGLWVDPKPVLPWEWRSDKRFSR